MQMRRVVAVICILGLGAGSIAQAAAQSGLQPVADSKRLFTISLPSSWKTASTPASDGFFSGLRATDAGKFIVSTLSASGPARGDDPPPSLAVAALDLGAPMSPSEFGERFGAFVARTFTVTTQGLATIAGRNAFYVYILDSRTNMYGVVVYFTVGRIGFLVFGATINRQERIQEDFSVISRSLETFRPKLP